MIGKGYRGSGLLWISRVLVQIGIGVPFLEPDREQDGMVPLGGVVVPTFGLIHPKTDHIGPSPGLGGKLPTELIQESSIRDHGLVPALVDTPIQGQGTVLYGGVALQFGSA